MQAQIRQREELIGTMNSEVFRVEQEIASNEELVRSLRKDLEQLKEAYARMVQYAYANRNALDRLSYVFAAESFSQAFRRSRYLDQLAEQRRQQAALITETSTSLSARVEELKGRRQEKVSLLSEQLQEKRRLSTDKDQQVKTLTSLQREEGKLRETLRRQEKKKRDLAAQIRKAIEDEIRASTKGSSGGKGGKGGKAGASTAGTSATRSAPALTPEAKELNADFEKNKGKLPWPVAKGTITGSFGKHAHPVLRGITVENNGIDISCEKGADVRAMFRGEVSSVIVIPGAGKAVVISHGAYRSVYSNLREVSVSKGQKVDTKQTIGTVMTDEDGSTAHVEIWKITAEGELVKVDPGAWIYRER